MRNASDGIAECIPQNCRSNSIEDNIQYDIEDKHNDSSSNISQSATFAQSANASALQQQNDELKAEIERLRATVAAMTSQPNGEQSLPPTNAANETVSHQTGIPTQQSLLSVLSNQAQDDTPNPIVTNTTREKGKGKRKGKVSLTDTTPIPPPEKPSEDQPWTPQVCMELADYYRGVAIPENNHKSSRYVKARDAAINVVNRQHKTYQEVDRVFRYMKCVDKDQENGLWDKWWHENVLSDVDIWHVSEHCEAKLKEIAREVAKQQRPSTAIPGAASGATPSQMSNGRPVASTPGSQYLVDFTFDENARRQKAFDLFDDMGRLDLFERYANGETALYAQYAAMPVGA